MPQTVYVYNIGVYFPKTSCIAQAVDEYLEVLVTGGFILKIRSLFIPNDFEAKKEQNHPKPLKNSQLYAIYVSVLCGLILALLIFILEMISEKIDILKIIMDVIEA